MTIVLDASVINQQRDADDPEFWRYHDNDVTPVERHHRDQIKEIEEKSRVCNGEKPGLLELQRDEISDKGSDASQERPCHADERLSFRLQVLRLQVDPCADEGDECR